MSLRNLFSVVSAASLLVLGAPAASAQDMLDRILEGSSGYFNTEPTTGSTLTRLDDRVWTFNHFFNRGLIIEGNTSLIVVD